jgi:hypothetical protein
MEIEQKRMLLSELERLKTAGAITVAGDEADLLTALVRQQEGGDRIRHTSR